MERLTVQPFRSKKKKKSDIASKQGGKKVAINIVDTPKKVFHCIFLGKKAIIITSKHGTTIFFPITVLFYENFARKAHVNTERVYRIAIMPPEHLIILLKSN